MIREIEKPEKNSPLIQYALKGLERCWLPEHGRWSHIYHLDVADQPNESVPRSDIFYTLNVLLGFARVDRVPASINLREIFLRNAMHLPLVPVAKYAFGVAMWAAAELDLVLPPATFSHIEGMLFDKNNWRSFRAQDLGMILAGVVAQAKIEPGKWSSLSNDLFNFLVKYYLAPSGLFFDTAVGFRRRFSTFATQTYLTLACYLYGEMTNNVRAIEIANKCTRKLIERQGPNGEWPWFFDAESGHILDFYEVYTVHQCGMAPAFLEHAERHGVLEARNALIKGFNWVFGQNQLKIPMLQTNLNMTIRSQVRKGELHTKFWRVARALRNSVLEREAVLIDPGRLQLRRECRSYELGWILWSFGQRDDVPELTDNKIFLGR